MINDVDTEFVHISETIDQYVKIGTTLTDITNVDTTNLTNLQTYHPDPSFGHFTETLEHYKKQNIDLNDSQCISHFAAPQLQHEPSG